MTLQIRLYTRRDCCLCEEMKGVIRDVAEEVPLEVEEVRGVRNLVIFSMK